MKISEAFEPESYAESGAYGDLEAYGDLDASRMVGSFGGFLSRSAICDVFRSLLRARWRRVSGGGSTVTGGFSEGSLDRALRRKLVRKTVSVVLERLCGVSGRKLLAKVDFASGDVFCGDEFCGASDGGGAFGGFAGFVDFGDFVGFSVAAFGIRLPAGFTGLENGLGASCVDIFDGECGADLPRGDFVGADFMGTDLRAVDFLGVPAIDRRGVGGCFRGFS